MNFWWSQNESRHIHRQPRHCAWLFEPIAGHDCFLVLFRSLLKSLGQLSFGWKEVEKKINTNRCLKYFVLFLRWVLRGRYCTYPDTTPKSHVVISSDDWRWSHRTLLLARECTISSTRRRPYLRKYSASWTRPWIRMQTILHSFNWGNVKHCQIVGVMVVIWNSGVLLF